MDKSTLSMVVVVVVGIADAGESGKRGPAGADNAGGDIAVYPMLLGQLHGETCSSCKSFDSSFVHIEFQSPRCLLSLKGRTLSYLCKSHLACLRPHQRCPCDTRRGANPRVPTLLKVENCSYTFLGGELFLVHVGLFLHAAN